MICIDREMATASVAANCLFHDVEKGPIQVSGRYHHQFERRQGVWRFLSRRFELHFLTPLVNWQPVAGFEKFERV
nr:nuclear transport factor 2 family protein [Pseudomonas fulva]